MNTDIISYYKDRADEYEKIYDKPERRHDLSLAAAILQKIFAGKDVLEIACGTGYWTDIIAKTAHTILATDINKSVIDIAEAKHYSPAFVSFAIMDIFYVDNRQPYPSLFGGFIWSHIRLQELSHFIDAINKQVKSGGTVVLMDNNYVEGSSTPINESDELGNTYQMRKLEDGTLYKIVKNFPDEIFIREILREKARDIRFISSEYFWMIDYNTV